MKKVVLSVVLLLAVGAAAFVFLQQKQAASRIRATALAPADSLLFVHLPDIRQSAIRWPRTALAQIAREPEVQAFLERPRSKMPWLAEMDARIDQITHAAPREAFVAVTSLEGSSPRVVAGFSFSGSRAAVEELLAEPKAALRRAWPAGKADIVSYAGAEIETYTDKENVIAETIRDGWYLVSNQLELLEATLDRLDGKPGVAAAVGGTSLYQQALAPQPADADAVIFARLDTLADKLIALIAATGQQADKQQIAELKKSQALSATFKFDGEQIRDSLFVLTPEAAQHSPLARRGLDLSTPETLLYYTFNLPEHVNVPAQSVAPLALLIPSLGTMEEALAGKGLKFTDFAGIFGPEFSALVDWPQTDLQPTFLLGVDVRDTVRARDFMDALSTGSNSSGWTRREQEGVLLYSAPAQGLLPAPVVALTDSFLVLGFNQDVLASGVQRLKDKGAPLAKTPEYQSATKAVSTPTEAFGYLDTKRLFERSYGIFRPFLAMTLAFSPESGQYIDAGKLPTTDAISQHLSPSVYSQTSMGNGTLIESAGTLTFNQALIGVVAGAGAAALPNLKQALPNAQGLPGNLLSPGLTQPPSGTEPSVPQQPAKGDTVPAPPVSAPVSENP